MCFFISRDGNILTNRHVVRPEIDKDVIRRALGNQIVKIRSLFAAMRDAAEEQYNEAYYQGLYSDVDNSEQLEELRENKITHDKPLKKKNVENKGRDTIATPWD